MFDLSKAVKDWRKEFSHKSGLPAKRIDEIEAHLVDTIDALSHSHSEEEAFHEALERLGNPEELVAEYKKVHDIFYFDYFAFWLCIAILSVCTTIMLHGLYSAWEKRDLEKVFISVAPLLGFSISILQFNGAYAIFRKLALKTEGVTFACVSTKYSRWLLGIILSLYGFNFFMRLLKNGFTIPGASLSFVGLFTIFATGVGILIFLSRSKLSSVQTGHVCLAFSFMPYAILIALTWNHDPSPTVTLLVVCFIPILFGLFGAIMQKSFDAVDMKQEDA